MPLDSSSNQEQAILYQARTLAPAERSAFLNRACGQDEELRRRIEARLKAEAIQLPHNNADHAAEPNGTLILANGQPQARGSRAVSVCLGPTWTHRVPNAFFLEQRSLGVTESSRWSAKAASAKFTEPMT